MTILVILVEVNSKDYPQTMTRIRVDITETEKLQAIKEAWNLRSNAATIDFILANYADKIIADAQKLGEDTVKKLISQPNARIILDSLVA